MWRAAIAALAIGWGQTAPAADTNPDSVAQPTTFSSSTDLVVLHAMVTDRRGAPITGLTERSFTVFEDGRPQDISFFLKSDAPVSVGLLIDSSGSMFDLRQRVIAAAAAFVGARDSRDEFFALSFNDEVRSVLPESTPFTSDASMLRDRLAQHIGARGRTALYDAVLAGLDRLGRGSTHRKVLIILADGGDNASRASVDEVIERAQSSDTVIYAVALVDRADYSGSNTGTLRRLADATGGLVIAPRHVSSIAEGFQKITDDLRSGYTLAYVPARAERDGRFRRTRVAASLPGGQTLKVRSRPGYVIPAGRREQGP